jgi:hypothetical protein
MQKQFLSRIMAIRLNITVSLLALLILLWALNGAGTAIAADNNATSTNGTSTEPPANPEEEPDNATLTAIIHINNENGTNVKASDFRFYVDGVNPSPQTFTGSESP